jgi:hypothetical protein
VGKSITADLDRRCVSRKRPKLRVVGAARENVQHVTIWTVCGFSELIEIWTYEEWSGLESWERPDVSTEVPGIGFMSMRLADEDDVRATKDLLDQWRARG